MTLQRYEDFNFREETLAVIEKANEIISEFEDDGHTLSLRQLYYQFVARGLIENTERSYKRIGSIVGDGRLAGMISWDALEDRNRTSAVSIQANEDEADAVNGIEVFIKLDFWQRQGVYVEAWVEKDALLGVIQGICEKWKVPHMACKGNMSLTETYLAGQRFKEKAAEGNECILLHLGDHDPSGIDMTRDNEKRLSMFAEQPIEVRRLALNMNQVQKYSPPPNPTKLSDSRAEGYIKKFGMECWELDALSPKVISALLEKEITSFLDMKLWNATKDEQTQKRELVASIYDRWDEVKPFLEQLRDE